MIKRTIAGEERGFLFGTYTLKIIREVTGIEIIEDVFYGIANFTWLDRENGVKSDPIRSQIDHMQFLNSVLYACAKHACISEGKEHKHINEALVSDWMDELGLKEAMNLLTELIKSYTAKNVKAPVTGLAELQ